MRPNYEKEEQIKLDKAILAKLFDLIIEGRGEELSQEEVASKSCLSSRGYQNYEQRRVVKPSLCTVVRIAKTLDLDLNLLKEVEG